MVAVDRIVRICNRCIDSKLAVITVRFGFNGRMWTGDLCEQHKRNFERDILGWARDCEELTLEPAPEGTAATEIVEDKDTRFKTTAPSQRPTFADRRLKVAPVVPKRTVVVEDAQVTRYQPPKMDLSGITEKTMRSWTFSQRAYRDMDDAGITADRVWRIIDGPHEVRPARDADAEIWFHGPLDVVLNKHDKTIIHVRCNSVGGRLPLVSGGI